MIGLIVLWSFPVAFVGLLSNLSSLCTRVPWLAWVCRCKSCPEEGFDDTEEILLVGDVPQGIIQGLLPPVFLAILFLILPFILRGKLYFT